MKVTLVAVSQPVIRNPDTGLRLTAEDLLVYTARASSPENQFKTETGARLLAYCMRNGHWSIFEAASMTVEIQTSRAIAQQILRHRSFSFQEFSQRYAVATAGCEEIELRRKGASNRQGSLDIIEDSHLASIARNAVRTAEDAYASLLAADVAPECARFVLPLATKTTLYMTGSVRSWVHYLAQRVSTHAQKEHRRAAQEIAIIFAEVFPQTALAIATGKELDAKKEAIWETHLAWQNKIKEGLAT
jgi:thymidylate synthase (FAD)